MLGEVFQLVVFLVVEGWYCYSLEYESSAAPVLGKLKRWCGLFLRIHDLMGA